MNRILVAVAAFLLAAACATENGGPPTFQYAVDSSAKPWTHEAFDDDADKLTFAVISDLTGGEREKIFDIAVAGLNLLRPELIMSVGDLIDGVGENEASLTAEWEVFDGRTTKLTAPFFRVGGNHDLTGTVLRDLWNERYGPYYYHFTYKNALFLVLDTEDHSPKRMAEIKRIRDEAIKALDGPNPPPQSELAYFSLPERVTGNIGAEQAAYFEQIIADNPDVRWTFLFMHKPIWRREDRNDFNRIEDALKNRPYTLFNGHFHTYSYNVRKGRDYISLATTGGGQGAEDENSFDHVTLVTLSDSAPSIVNLRLDGILEKTGKLAPAADGVCFQAARCVGEN